MTFTDSGLSKKKIKLVLGDDTFIKYKVLHEEAGDRNVRFQEQGNKLYLLGESISGLKIGRTKVTGTVEGTKIRSSLQVEVVPEKVKKCHAYFERGGKRFLVIFDPVLEVSDYEIEYANDAKFTKGRKKIRTWRLGDNYIDIPKKKRKYYVRVRAYKETKV